jgi:cell division ATPase MinD
MTKYVGIVSIKGGVGKTTSCINISSALDWFRRDVILVDGNFSNPDVGINLGAELMEKTIHSALKGKHHIRESVYLHPSGLKIIPGNMSYREARTAKIENFHDILTELSGAAEVIIVDSAPGFGADAQTIIKAMDYLIIATTPDISSVANSIKMVKFAEEMKKEIVGIVVNRKENHEIELDTKNIEALLKRKVIGIIPEDHHVRDSLKHKNPVVFLHPNSPSANAFKKVAGVLIGEKYADNIEYQQDNSLYKLTMRAFGFDR